MRLRKDAKVELISKVPLFAGCSRSELTKVAQLADELPVEDGRQLTREGEPGREFFVLVDGEAVVRKKGRKVATLTSGDFFGEMALLTDAPRNATVVAAGDARVLVVTDRDFRKLLRDSPQVQLKVLQALAERIAPQTL
ncbi:MAG TPA: cyclic nucleotide-binding domain-containing protein [Gaiellaceae bacterium]|nr:cyclic nucleotide-binding domain-containing protein [Gaiellaceae bacterium]